MRIALVHSYYRSALPSGENLVVDLQAEALARAGHDVQLLALRTDEVNSGRTYPLRSAVTVATGIGPSPIEQIRAIAPDVVHVHNLFPNYGRTWLREYDGPLVATVHNYRSVCARGTLERAGQGCIACVEHGSVLPALVHRCYRDSTLATVPVAMMSLRRPIRQALLRRADRIVVPSLTTHRILREAGVPEGVLSVVPHFTPDPPQQTGPRAGWLWVGRLMAEKGLPEVLAHWPAGEPLLVVGDGPDRERCQQLAPPGVRFAGRLPHDRVLKAMGATLGLIVTSRAMETFGLTHAEALSRGTPVLALHGSAVADAVAHHATGAVFRSAADLCRAVGAGTWPARLNTHCRAVYERHFSEAGWLKAIEAVYEQVQVTGRAACHV